MSPTITRKTFEEDIFLLEKVTEWLDSIGITTSGTRFKQLLDRNKEIVAALKENRVDSLIDDHGNLVLWQAITDANSFIKVYNSFHNEKSHLLPRKSLKIILEGPFLPWDENPKLDNIGSRNILFELETAAVLKEAGVQLIGFDDVDFTFNGVRFNAQCKRVHSPKQIKNNVEKAIQQFTKRMGSENIKGLLCLSIDKLTEKENKILQVKTVQELEPIIAPILHEFIKDNRYLWTNIPNINIIGMLVSCQIVAWVREGEGNILTTCRQLMMDIIPNNQMFEETDHRLIMELSRKLKDNN